MKTTELTGAALDWAVAKCEGRSELGMQKIVSGTNIIPAEYSTNWVQGGPIIEREKMKVYPNVGGRWSAQMKHFTNHPLVSHPVIDGWTNGAGDTPLVAAMRCYVASKLGDDVEIPEELL